MDVKDNIIITELNNVSLFMCMKDNQIDCLDYYKDSDIGSIYVGMVDNVVKNINGAFVRYQKDMIGYLDFREIHPDCILNRDYREAPVIRQGDLVLVQIANDAIKMKQPKLTCNISISGRYLAITLGKKGLGSSRKISESRKEQLMSDLTAYIDGGYDRYLKDHGVVIRTEAGKEDVSIDDITAEFNELKSQMDDMLSVSQTRVKYTIIHKQTDVDIVNEKILKMVHYMESHQAADYEIISDSIPLYNKISEELDYDIKLWTDETPMSVLFGISKKLDELTGRKVWLKSGGFLIIEHTEALEVIDVNSGKNISKKNIVSQINLEAVDEAFRQIRLRNLSGMILIDLINIDNDEDKNHIINRIKRLCVKDPIKTTFIDITGLGIVEITRKKSGQSLKELLTS